MKVVIFDDLLFRTWGQGGPGRLPGITLALYEHADEVVEVVAREQPDLVCMDFFMHASHSGGDAVALLRRDPRFSGLPIVGISADRDANERMLAAGASDAVPKSHLRGYLQRWQEQRRLAAGLR